MSTKSCHFTHAIVRTPGRSIHDGLRAVDTGAPDLNTFNEHHRLYAETLASTGAHVITLPAAEEYPDSVFVEDAALCLPELAIVMRPGAPTRLGEAALMVPTLEEFYSNVHRIDGSGFIEGGDILTTEKEILVGLSERTNESGVRELNEVVSHYGYSLRIVNTPTDLLHFKTDCSLLDEETILSTRKLAASGCFDGYRVIHAVDGEEACANSIRFNNLVLMPDGFPGTADLLMAHGYSVKQIGNSEASKLDGGMSCLSLRFSPS